MTKKKILLVENNRAITFLIGTLLEKHYDILQVPDSRYAMQELFVNHSPDLIIISVDSMQSDNSQLIHHVWSSSLLKYVPLIILGDNESEQFEVPGNARFILKPFDPIQFIDIADELTSIKSGEIINKKINLFQA